MSMVRCDECDLIFDSDNDPDCFEEVRYGINYRLTAITDTVICENCRQNADERAWERHCEDFHDGGSTRFISLQQQQEAARRLK